jgi:hypothetical protein
MSGTTKIKRQFLNSLKRGTGETYLIAKSHSAIDFSNEVIKGALNIYAYDGQCEGDRAEYIFGLISISKQKSKIRDAVLNGLASEQKESWNLTHLFALTKLYAQQNDPEAKQAIYDRFLNNPIEGSDWVGYSEILELDGLNGLLHISEKFGRYLEQNPDDWQDDSIIKRFQEENQDIKVFEELESSAKFNKFIRLYLDNIERTKENWVANKSEPIKHRDIVDEVFNSKSSLSFFKKRRLAPEEVNQIANRLLTETGTSNLEKLLDVFDYHRFPLDSELILNFAKQRRTVKHKIVQNAIGALKNLKSKNIRNFAIDKILNSKYPIDYLQILISNYHHGDFKILSDIASKTNNEHKIEQLAGIYSDIYKANKTRECKEPLEILYSKMNCAIHRNAIIEILMENKVLSDKIREEIKFDSYLETRILVK